MVSAGWAGEEAERGRAGCAGLRDPDTALHRGADCGVRGSSTTFVQGWTKGAGRPFRVLGWCPRIVPQGALCQHLWPRPEGANSCFWEEKLFGGIRSSQCPGPSLPPGLITRVATATQGTLIPGVRALTAVLGREPLSWNCLRGVAGVVGESCGFFLLL